MLIAFVPVCGALLASFLAIRSAVSELVVAGLRQTLHENQQAIDAARSKAEARTLKLLSSLQDHEVLRAGLTLLADRKGVSGEARAILESQLFDLNRTLNFDTMIVSDLARHPLAGLQRVAGGQKALKGAFLPQTLTGEDREMIDLERGVFQLTTVPLVVGSAAVGYLSIGERFDTASHAGSGQAVLLRDGHVVQSSLNGVSPEVIENQVRENCSRGDDCEISVGDDVYLATSIQGGAKSRYRLINLQSLDRASQRFLYAVLKVFTMVATATLAVVFVLSLFGSQSVARPLAGLLDTLRHAQETGELRGGLQTRWGTMEVDQLAEAFNHAAESIAGKQKQLDKAYREFAESMARTLDARDPYTAGHSLRVAHYSRAVGGRMGLDERELDVIETGARLHDIGKIGIPDSVLQKAGRLTDEEFKTIRAHPQIGKRMLKRVGGFEPYLPVIEFHHENHDGTGYPYGMRGKDIPLCARIVHVADAYDAMTSHRTYRKAMEHDSAVTILREKAGTQFDPEVVRIFVELFPAATNPEAERDLPVQLLA